jgi:hypothetical protein
MLVMVILEDILHIKLKGKCWLKHLVDTTYTEASEDLSDVLSAQLHAGLTEGLTDEGLMTKP